MFRGKFVTSDFCHTEKPTFSKVFSSNSPLILLFCAKGDASKSGSEINLCARSMEDVNGSKKDLSASAGSSNILFMHMYTHVLHGCFCLNRGKMKRILKKTTSWELAKLYCNHLLKLVPPVFKADIFCLYSYLSADYILFFNVS